MTLYPTPRRAIFEVVKVPTEYTIDKGWANEPEELTVIGETEDGYIRYVRHHVIGWWHGSFRGQKITLTPYTIHRTRFVRWVDHQLSILSNPVLHTPIVPRSNPQ